MAAEGAPDHDAVGPNPGLWQRFLDLIRKPDDGQEHPTIGERFTKVVLRADSGAEPKPEPTTVEELDAAVKRADDKERLIGLIAAPFAGMIALLITGSLIANDPKATLADGAVNKAHVNPSLYSLVGIVLLGLAVVMLAMAWWRRRTYLAIAMALFGISVFNLKFWGFGVPYVLVGAWLLVRGYRLNTKLKLARGDAPSPPATGAPARASKRYTPRTAPPGKRKAG